MQVIEDELNKTIGDIIKCIEGYTYRARLHPSKEERVRHDKIAGHAISLLSLLLTDEKFMPYFNHYTIEFLARTIIHIPDQKWYVGYVTVLQSILGLPESILSQCEADNKGILTRIKSKIEDSISKQDDIGDALEGDKLRI